MIAERCANNQPIQWHSITQSEIGLRFVHTKRLQGILVQA